MLPPEFEPMIAQLAALYRKFLMQDNEAVAVPELLTAEERIVTFVRALGLALLRVFVEVRLLQAKAGRRPCSCGVAPTVHRMTEWTRETPFGPLVVRDPYVYCPTCHESERPLHAFLGTDRETWSLVVQETAVDLVADESAGKAVAKLERHHPGIKMDRTAALRMLHEHGQRAREFIDGKLAAARKLAELPGKLRGEGAEELEVEFDAGMIPVATLESIEPLEGEEPERTPVRGLPKRRKVCRWEEAKVGLVQKPGEVDRLYSVRPTAGLVESFEDLFALACLKGWTEQTQVRGLADGALHIRPRMEETFHVGDFRFILDRPHCKEHLTTAGEARQAEGALDTVTVQQWAAGALGKMEVAGAAEVVEELNRTWEASGTDRESRNDTLRREAAYFERNSDAVVYAEYRAHGWSTASSEVESAQGHVVQVRLKISGAWWDPAHVDDVLALRVLEANEGWWDEYWNEQRRAWRRRAQHFAETRRDRAA
jgi:hypothetical protein